MRYRVTYLQPHELEQHLNNDDEWEVTHIFSIGSLVAIVEFALFDEEEN